MKTDLKLNYGEIESIISNLQKYETSLTTMKSSIESIEKNLKQSESKAVKELINNFTFSEKDIESSRIELEQIRKLLSNYILDLSKYATPIKRDHLMQIDRVDVWANIVSIENGIGTLYKAQGGVGRYGSLNQDADIIAAEESNAREIQRFNKEVQKSIKKLYEQVDKIWRIYNNKIVPFETTDNEYQQKSRALYVSNVNLKDFLFDVSDFIKISKIKFQRGAVERLKDTIKGTCTLIYGVKKFVYGGYCLIFYLPFGEAPDWAREGFYGGLGVINALIYEPKIILEGIAQDVSDKVDNEGLFYMAGSIAMDITIAQAIAAAKNKIKGTSGGGSRGNGEYTVPEGGGGATDTIKIDGKEITMEHGGRHLKGTGLSVSDVNNAIAKDVVSKNLTPNIVNRFTININGITLEYRAFLLPDGTINIGTYFVLGRQLWTLN